MSLSSIEDAGAWGIISLVVAIIGGFVLYFSYLSKANEGKFEGFKKWMYDFLSFKKMVIENILRVAYVILAIFITLSSFAFISDSFLYFILYLVVGNLVLRIMFEFSLITLIICRNTTEINSKMNKHE